jgi:hypothetical protein
LKNSNLEHSLRPQAASAGLLTAPFIVAVLLLAAAAIIAGPVATRLNIRHAKLPLPLRTALYEMNAEGLWPYRLLSGDRGRHVLDPVVVEALGTEDYLSWTLEDTGVDASDPLRFANLFVTYYTGADNLVPHTPDVCYLGFGYSPAQAHENVDVELRSLPGDARTVPLRVCTFVKTAVFDRDEVTVVYTFNSNGRFAATRTGVRLLLNDLATAHAYFCKVEVSFPRANRAQSIAGAARLFDRVLPELMRRHWPDFKAAENRAGRTAGASD